jgi:hypothetical protein
MNLKKGDINPLTGDKIINRSFNDLESISTAREIEIWMIVFLD